MRSERIQDGLSTERPPSPDRQGRESNVRRLFILLLALALGGVAAFAETNVPLYLSDFTTDADGWVARSAGSASVSLLDEGALRIVGRDSDWNSPGRDFDLVPGGRYVFSVQARQDQQDEARFMVSVAHTADGVESYENLAFATAKRGEWTELSGEYVAGNYSRFVLYVETTGAPTLDFDIRDFRLEAPDGEPELAPTPVPMEIPEVDDMPSLKEIYADRFDIGTCAGGWIGSREDYMDFARSQFSIITPENELKPDSVLDVAASQEKAGEDDAAVAVRFDAVKPILDFALDSGLKVHGHVLVWHNQTPEAFFHEGYQADAPLVSRELMLARLESYIAQIMTFMDENYPGVVVSWDVVNEAVDDATGELRDSMWLNVVGEDYLARAFELARKYAPEGTLLYYNDYNTAYQPKQDGIVKLLKELMAEGNIDGYGFQMHNAAASPTIEELTAAVERVAALGLRLRVSELDITVDANDEDSFTLQAQVYADVMKLLSTHADQIEAVQFWGMTDNMSWRGSQYPLLFDANRNPKPAFWAVADPDSVE